MSVESVFGILGGAAAVASAVAAASAARIASRANRPFVHGSVTSAEEGWITVTVKNDGPGTAVDVAFGPEGEAWKRLTLSVAPGASCAHNFPTSRKFNLDAAQRAFEMGQQAVIAEFSGLDGTRWRVTHSDTSKARLERLRWWSLPDSRPRRWARALMRRLRKAVLPGG